MKEFTEDEKTVARNIDKKYKWIARDENGFLKIYTQKPIKRKIAWFVNRLDDCDTFAGFKYMFQSIRWEDDEPTRISDIYNPQILDDVEREYLKAVLKPFHEEVENDVKSGNRFDGDRGYYIKEYLLIKLYNEEFAFPDFDEGEMYSGMKLNKKYTLDELGITYDD